MQFSNTEPTRWAIILAGGDGKRLSPLTRRITGEEVPKQFCPLIGQSTLLEQTRRRVTLAVESRRTLASLTRSHERFYAPLLADLPRRNLVIQPRNRETAPAILYSLLRLALIDPEAFVALFPSDHYVSDERRFMHHVESAFREVGLRPELMVLLGIAPDGPDPGYGWIEPGIRLSNGAAPVFAVRRFWEKPAVELARELWRRGCLWNSFVMVARVSSLLDLTAAAVPGLYSAFLGIFPKLSTDFEQSAVESLYASLRPLNFSHEVLAHYPRGLAVLPVSGLEWSDLGDTRRVLETLARTGIRPEWSG